MTDRIAPRDLARQRILDGAHTAQRLLSDAVLQGLEELSSTLAHALSERRTVFFFGNGGSAAEATHLAAELVGRFSMERAPLPALSLTDNASALTAIANDYGYESALARQLTGLARPGDVAVGLTTSGASPNVVAALRAGREHGLFTAVLTGAADGPAAAAADLHLAVPASETARIQEAHLLLGHILCELVELELFGSAETPARALRPIA